MFDSVAHLNDRFAIAGLLEFADGPSGLPLARIAGPEAEATVSLSGGQVLSWTPRGQAPVLWLSPQACHVQGKAIRGGVPICWPWFGPHGEADFPAHGIARTAPWTVRRSQASPDGSLQLSLAMQATSAGRALWPHAVTAQVFIAVGRELRIDLISKNSGNRTAVIGEALHTYFAVSDIRKVGISGLADATFIDKADAGRRKVQAGSLVIGSEVDRVYINTTSECCIEDRGHKRCIRIRKSGSRSTIVWNPWSEKAARIEDLGADGHLGMLCVESGNALENVVTVEPGAEHILSVRYSVEALG